MAEAHLMVTHEIYIKRVDKGGGVTITSHIVWDTEAFMTARKKEMKKEKGSVEQITEAQYREYKWKKEPA